MILRAFREPKRWVAVWSCRVEGKRRRGRKIEGWSGRCFRLILKSSENDLMVPE